MLDAAGENAEPVTVCDMRLTPQDCRDGTDTYAAGCSCPRSEIDM